MPLYVSPGLSVLILLWVECQCNQVDLRSSFPNKILLSTRHGHFPMTFSTVGTSGWMKATPHVVTKMGLYSSLSDVQSGRPTKLVNSAIIIFAYLPDGTISCLYPTFKRCYSLFKSTEVKAFVTVAYDLWCTLSYFWDEIRIYSSV